MFCTKPNILLFFNIPEGLREGSVAEIFPAALPRQRQTNSGGQGIEPGRAVPVRPMPPLDKHAVDTPARSHWGRNSEPRFRQARRFRRSGQGGCRSGVLRWPYATLSPCREKVYDPSDVRNKCFPHSFSSGSLVKATCSQDQ